MPQMTQPVTFHAGDLATLDRGEEERLAYGHVAGFQVVKHLSLLFFQFAVPFVIQAGSPEEVRRFL